MRILVVEDERLLCDGIAEDLRLEKYTVDCCYDGAAACERLFVEPYDLVVLDLNLPGMDGLELLRSQGKKCFFELFDARGGLLWRRNDHRCSPLFC